MSRLLGIVLRDLHLALRQGMDSTMVVTFFIVAVVREPVVAFADFDLLITSIAAGIADHEGANARGVGLEGEYHQVAQ